MTSADGRAVMIEGSIGGGSGVASTMYANFGRLSLVKNSGSDILLSGGGQGIAGASVIGFAGASTTSQYSMSLRETKMQIGGYEADAMGMYGDRFGFVAHSQGISVMFGGGQGLSTVAGFNNFGTAVGQISVFSQIKDGKYIYSNAYSSMLQSGTWAKFNSLVVHSVAGTSQVQIVNQTAGVTTLKGAMAMMDIVETAILNVDQIRANIGSAQQQIDATINNISTTQVNLKSAESVIRDLDFASESANYSKSSILAQSGAYALAQANASSQYVMQLLQ